MPKNIRRYYNNTTNPFGASGLRWATLVLTAGLAAGCGGASHGGPVSTVRFDLAADPQNLNPLFLNPDAASVEQQVARLVFEPFIDLDSRGRPVPALLEGIPTRVNGGLSADGRTIRYRLRRGVRWSDGVPVTARDVLFTLRAILDPHNPVRSQEGYDLIDRAIALDSRTVVLHLRRAWAPAVMTYFSYGFSPQFVLPEHVLRAEQPLARAAFNAAPAVGDGPYRFLSWKRGEGLRYAANARYWRGEPAVASLVVSTIPDPSTNLLLLQSGALDWNLLAPAQLAVVRGDPRIGFVAVPTAVVAGLAFNTAHRPLDDVRVRRALAMSVDRDSIVRKITLGFYPVTDMIQPRFSWAFDPSVRLPRYDPSGADRLFDAAGWRRGPDGMRRRAGVPLHLVYVQFPETATGVRVAVAVAAALRQRGVDVTVKAVSNAQLFLPRTGVLAAGAFDVAYVPWTMGADPDDSSVLACGAPSNYMRWCDPQVDALERAALSATGESARKALYARIGRIVAQQVPILYLFNADYVYAYRKRLRGFSPNAFLPTWNAYQWRL
ncbi:MAG TPA: peptide ABC transporter substrate-binding protein [Candidatus Dormibacteraeota bacterium]|nr:peptide ABC transporter substrate-binding protein [Candidatus Dormibacteraeota bacterium]